MKVAELADAKLDYWAAMAEELDAYIGNDNKCWVLYNEQESAAWYSPSTCSAQGYPLMERYGISVSYHEFYGDGLMKPITESYWRSYLWKPGMKDPIRFEAKRGLIAIVRSVVAIKFGDEVPD